MTNRTRTGLVLLLLTQGMKRILAIVVLGACISACGANSNPNAPSPSETKVIALTGNATDRAGNAYVTFDHVSLWTTATAVLTITNSGNATLTVAGITGPINGFTADWARGPVPPGGSQKVTLSFSPTTPGSYYGTIVVAADHTGGTNSILVSGTVSDH